MGLTIAISLGLAAISFAMGISWIAVSHESRLLWDVASEANLWTWFSVAVLISAAYGHLIAALICWLDERGSALLWVATALCLALMSMDDAASLHERLLAPLGYLLGGGSGLTLFAWIIPGSVVALVIIVVFARMLVHVTGRPRRLGIAGLAMFFLGAIGMEMLSGLVLEESGSGLGYLVAYHVEELLEAIGASLLLGAGLAELPVEMRSVAAWRERKREIRTL